MNRTLRCLLLTTAAMLSFGAMPALSAEVPVGGYLDGERVETTYKVGCRRYRVGPSEWIKCRMLNDENLKDITFFRAGDFTSGSAEVDGERGWSFVKGKGQTLLLKGKNFIQIATVFW